MSKVCILFSITLILSFIVISLASWDAPVQTIEKEETIPIPHNSHQQDSSISVISNQDDEVRENRVEPVLIVTTTFPSSISCSTHVTMISTILTIFACFLFLNLN